MKVTRNISPPILLSLLLVALLAFLWSGDMAPGRWLPEAVASEVATAAAEDADTAQELKLRPAPRPGRADYPDIGVSSRAVVWIISQMHLFFGALVLAVPLFVLVIELLGLYTRDARYDDMAHEFMKISITAYSITALFGGTLALALFLLYPDLMAYLMQAFGSQLLVYAMLFFLESMLLSVVAGKIQEPIPLLRGA